MIGSTANKGVKQKRPLGSISLRNDVIRLFGFTRTHSALGIVLVGLWVTKVNQHPVAHILRNETAEALDGLCNALLVGRNDFAEVFGVHACRHRR